MPRNGQKSQAYRLRSHCTISWSQTGVRTLMSNCRKEMARLGCSPSLDRIDPNKGYVPGNIIVICHRANCIKADATAKEIEDVANWLQREERGRIEALGLAGTVVQHGSGEVTGEIEQLGDALAEIDAHDRRAEEVTTAIGRKRGKKP